MAPCSIRAVLTVGVLVASHGALGETWHANTVHGWARDASCSAEHLAGPDGSKCGAGTVFVSVPEDDAAEPSIEFLTLGAGGGLREAPFPTDALVEVGSISKVFTAVLLQQLVDSDQLSLETELGEILHCPGAYRNPEVLNITMLELASHMSGLPIWPCNRRRDQDNPFANYTHGDLCSCLTSIRDLPNRGKFFYSNLAYGILGYLMELKMGKGFEDLVAERIFTPLGMQDTKVTLSDAEWEHRVAPGVKASTGLGPVWRRSPYGVLRGNGAFHSTLADLAQFIVAAIRAERGDQRGLLSGTLRRSMKQITWDCACVRGFCEKVECVGPSPDGGMVGLGWHSFSHGSLRGWRKAGDVEGYSSLMAFMAQAGRGAFGFDTCGGCGLNGTRGSAIQRAVQALVTGPECLADDDAADAAATVA